MVAACAAVLMTGAIAIVTAGSFRSQSLEAQQAHQLARTAPIQFERVVISGSWDQASAEARARRDQQRGVLTASTAAPAAASAAAGVR